MRKLVLFGLVAALGVLGISAVALASRSHDNDGGGGKARLNGYQEVVGGPGASTGSVSTTGHGSFRFQIREDPLRIHYVLKYEDMQGTTVSVSHLHFAERHVGGGVSVFLCGGGGKPACTTPSGRFEGDIVAADVVGPADQGIAAGELTELIRAIRAGAVYANVHSTPQYPEGEIRGQLSGGGGDHGDRKKDRH
jgi:CHRD domain